MTTLPSYSNCVLDHRYFLGSFRDWSGNSNHGTPSQVYWSTGKDNLLSFTTYGLVTVADTDVLMSSEGTLITYAGVFDTYESYDVLLSKRDGGGAFYETYFNSDTGIAFWDGSVERTATINWKGSRFIAITYSSGSAPKAYVDGRYVSDFSGTVTMVSNDAPLRIGNYYAGQYRQSNPLKGALIYNIALTDSDVAQAFEWTEQFVSLSPKKSIFSYPLTLRGNENNLLVGYDMKSINGVIVDKSTNGKNAAVTGCTSCVGPIGNYLNIRTAGSNVAVTKGSPIDNVVSTTYSFLLNLDSAGENNAGRIFDKSRRTLYADATGHLIFTVIFDGGAGYWTTAGALEFGRWYHVAVTMDVSSGDNNPIFYVDGEVFSANESGSPSGSYSSDSSYNFIIGNNTSFIRAMDGCIGDFRVYNTELTQTEIKKIYKNYANTPLFVDDLSDANESVTAESGAFLSNTEWRISSGSYKVGLDTTSGHTVGSNIISDGDAEDSSGPELMVDGDMEAVDASAYTPTWGATVTKESGSATGSGAQVLKISNGGIGSADQNILTGNTVTVTGWARGDGGTGQPAISDDTGGITWVGTTGDSWQQFSVTGTGGTTLSLVLIGGGSVYFDDVSVVATCPAWTSGNTAILTKETSNPYRGSNVIRVTNTDGESNPFAYQNVAEVGKTYKIHAWARSDGTSIPSVLGYGTIWTGDTSTAWQEINVTFTQTTSGWIGLKAGTSTSGAWVEFDDVEIYEIDKDEKVLECTSNGIIYREYRQAYGTWEFDCYKGLDANYPVIGFVSAAPSSPLTTANAYAIYSDGSTNRLRLYEGGSGALFSTANDYISINTWYSFKVTRSATGVFTVYIKGGSFNGWTLVSADSGTNPVTDTTTTSSKYLVLDLDSGDKVANFKFYQGVV